MSASAPSTPAAAFDAKLPPFDFSRSLALVTGGNTGIGLGIVKELVARNCKVIITGRRLEALQEAQRAHPDGIVGYYVSDAGDGVSRAALVDKVSSDHPTWNVLINNAGVTAGGNPAELVGDPQDGHGGFSACQRMLDTNVAGPMHLTCLALPHLLRQDPARGAMVVNLSSGLAFLPGLNTPAYAASKAAIHHYTLALRGSLAQTHVRVVEIVPPMVKTDFSPLVKANGVELDPFCASVVTRVADGEIEVGYDYTERSRHWTRQQQWEALTNMAKNAKLITVPEKQ